MVELVNLFNYVDRYVVAAVVGPIKRSFFGKGGLAGREDVLSQALNWFQQHVGFKPDDACLGPLATAFMAIEYIGRHQALEIEARLKTMFDALLVHLEQEWLNAKRDGERRTSPA